MKILYVFLGCFLLLLIAAVSSLEIHNHSKLSADINMAIYCQHHYCTGPIYNPAWANAFR